MKKLFLPGHRMLIGWIMDSMLQPHEDNKGPREDIFGGRDYYLFFVGYRL